MLYKSLLPGMSKVKVIPGAVLSFNDTLMVIRVMS